MKRLSIHDGAARWFTGLGVLGSLAALFRRRPVAEPVPAGASRREPRTEAERALWHAMGWVEDGWEE